MINRLEWTVPTKEGETFSKKSAQNELREIFDAKDTSSFRKLLADGRVGMAKDWLQYIIDNRKHFPQYDETWNDWLKDRLFEIEEIPVAGETRTKEEAQKELMDKFGFCDTKGFRTALKTDVMKAGNWLKHIIENKKFFPQYLATWDSWLVDRQRELVQAKDK